MDQIKIGKFIASCRKEKNLTQSELAEKLGISDRTISKWETGRGMPDLSLFKSLCETLDLTYNDLLNGEKCIETNQNYEKVIENTIEYSNKKLKQKNKLIDILYLLIVGLFIFIFSYFWKSPSNIYGGVLTSFCFMAISCLLPVFFITNNHGHFISIISFTCCFISILNLFHLTYHFCMIEDISALYDTMPSIFFLSKFCVIVTISINIIYYFINRKVNLS